MPSPLRILYWTELHWPHVGGVEMLAVPFLAALRERGHEPLVVTGLGSLDLPAVDEHQGTPIHRFPFAAALEGRDPGAIARILRQVADLERAFRPDVVHVNVTDPSPFFHLRAARTLPPAPLLAALHVAPDVRSAGSGTLLGELLGRAGWVTANSHAVLDDIRALAPGIAGRSSVIHNGLDPPPGEPRPEPEGPPVVVGLGRLVDDKGFDVAVEALARLRRHHPDARLVLAGDGPARAELLALAQRLGLEDAVELVGWVAPDDVPAFLAQATVVVVPSRWREAFGLVALQAALADRAVVASAVGGLPEVVEDGVTGWLVPKEDPEALADALARALDDPVARQAAGRRARARAVERFGFGRYVAGYARLYRQLTNGDPRHAG